MYMIVTLTDREETEPVVCLLDGVAHDSPCPKYDNGGLACITLRCCASCIHSKDSAMCDGKEI